MLRRNVNLIHYINKKYANHAVNVTYRFKSGSDRTDEYQKECPPDGSGRGFYYTVGGVIVGTGAFVLYAKYDDDFRKWLKDNLPSADNFVAVVTAENKSYSESLTDAAIAIKEAIISAFGGIELPGGEKKQDCGPDKPSSPPPPPAPAKSPPAKSEQSKPVDPPKPKAPSKDDASKVGVLATFDITGVQMAMAAILARTQTLKVALEKAYKEVLCIYKDLSDFYQKVVDGSVQTADPSVMNKIRELRTSKSEALKVAEENYKDALSMLEDIKTEMNAQERIIKRSSLISEEQKAVIGKVKDDIYALFKELDEMKRNFEREKARLSLSEKYWKQVQEARKHFSDELEILFPNVRIQDKNMKLADEELDLFILYAFQNILFYQKELAKLDGMYKANLEKAFSSNVEEKEVIRAVIENETEQERRKIGAEFQKRMLVIRAECERDLRQGMMRQAEAHVAHIKELTELKEKQAEMKLQRAMDEKMAEMRQDHQSQLADIIGRMRALDAIISKKMEADARSNKSQELWAACQALQDALQATDPSEGMYKQFRPLEGLVEAVYASAAPGDEYVDAVLSSLPTEARRRGVFTSLMLKDRFLNVKRVAKKVALLPEGGAPLPVMLLSWVQAKLIIDSDEIPVDELNNKEFDPTKLNTFQILNRANYWMERNDYKQALRYMNLLQGAARAVAGDWIRETQIYLEVSQAARALMAYAAASSSIYS